MSRRPPPRKSGRAPRREAPDAVSEDTVDALQVRVRSQNAREPLHPTSKAHRLAKICGDLELAVIVHAAPHVIAELALDAAAFAIRIREQGD